METPSSVEVQHKLSCEGAWSWKPPRALKVGQREAVGAPLPLRSRGEPGGRFLIPKMPALPNVSQQRRLPHYWWPRSLHWEALNQQHEKKTESPSLPTANPLHSPHVSLPVDLRNNEVPSRIRHGAAECCWGSQNGEGAENKEVILDYEINQETIVPGEQTNDHVIEKNWMVGKQRGASKDEIHKGLWEAPPTHITKHQVLVVSVRSRGTMGALWKQTGHHTNCCLKLPVPYNAEAGSV